MKTNDLKARMAAGETVYGLFINSGSTIAAEIAGMLGFDFVMIDSEHGPTMPEKNRDLITAAEYRNTVPLVRVPNADYNMILRSLDIGAHGVMIPQVNTADKARAVVSAAYYSPTGNRGVAMTRSSDYGCGLPMREIFNKANERNMVLVQCENIVALKELDEICTVPGVDVVFVGPYDLSSSMGQLGKVDYDSIRETVDLVLEKTRKYGKAAGIFSKNAAEAKKYAEMGFRLVIVSTDINCLISGMCGIVNTLKA